ncbi:hypothetical protein [Dactylosporangium sp. NPDC049140]|uniref:hypothetical protein n=1 Tax=Dactylosporangium sp. NPDC049140 TaxID=3155647 RepID=UPI00340E3E8B
MAGSGRDALLKVANVTKRHERELVVAEQVRSLAGDGMETVVTERRLMDAAISRATERLMAELEDQSRLVR